MRSSKDKANATFYILKELGYLLLLLVFFIGILLGSLSLKNVSSTSFNEYSESLQEKLEKLNNNGFEENARTFFDMGVKTIVIFWIVGMSIVGTPILIGYLGYKGYSLGYTLSVIIKIMGIRAGNHLIFKYLFFKNVILIFIMIFLANSSLKVAKNFFEKRSSLKEDAIKFTMISVLCFILWLIIHLLEQIFLTTF